MRVGIAGLDSFYFSQMFASHIQSIPGAELAGFASLNAPEEQIVNNSGLSSEQFSSKFQAPVYQTLEELLDRGEAEAVCLCTRPSVMPALVKQLADKGIHVFAAKPVAVTDEGLGILESLRACSSVVSAGPTSRFDPVFVQARQRVENDEIGTITAVRVLHQHGMLRFWPDKCWYYDRAEGGIEFFLAWYCFDLLRWFTGQEITAIQGMGAKTVDSESPHFDVLKAICRLENGALGSFDVLFNVSWPYPMFEMEIIGAKGAIRIQQDGHEGRLFNQDGTYSFGRQVRDTLSEELSDWLKACAGEKQPSVSLNDVLRYVRSSLQLKRCIHLNNDPLN